MNGLICMNQFGAWNSRIKQLVDGNNFSAKLLFLYNANLQLFLVF